MIRRRSSSRCSRKLIAGMDSSACPEGGISAATSGIGSLAGGFGLRHGSSLARVSAGYGDFPGLQEWQNLGLVDLVFQISDFRLDLRLELVAGSAELVEGLADLPPDFRQLLRPKDDKGQQEDEHHLWKAEVHTDIIPPSLHRQQLCAHVPIRQRFFPETWGFGRASYKRPQALTRWLLAVQNRC